MNTYQAFKDFIDNQLNPEQREAVIPQQGVLCVCAGAGSGKTRVITARMAYLMIEHQVKAHQIIALTFTNKAAKEMKERIERFLGKETPLPYVGTFHAYCLRLLKSNAHLLPFSTFSLMDESDQEKLIKTIIAQKNLSKKITPGQALSAISRIKNEATNDAERAAVWGNDHLLRELYELYEKHKSAAHCFDFDDLLLQTLQLFRNENFRKVAQLQTRHILVDEYQDTNKVQHALLKAMTLDEKRTFALDSLCVVGDEDQSIYSWRGATVSNIVNFAKDFSGAISCTITRNYRSVDPILHVANEVIKHNNFRNPKKLYSGKDGSDRIRILGCSSGYQEGEALAQFMKLSRTVKPLSGHAVLYRSHFQSRSLEEALIRHAIPYKIIGAIQFYDRLEIKDMLGYMRLILNPYDRMAFARVINTPSRGFGDKFEELFYETWDMMPFEDFRGIAKVLIEHKKLTKSKEDALIAFLALWDGLTPETKPSRILTTLIDRTQYYTYLANSFEKPEAEAKRENLKELINGVLFYEERNEPTLDGFLQEVSLLQEHKNASDDAADYVSLMTFHAAKGLEFDTVILTGVEEGVLPSSRSMYNPDALEEERRLLYVGITRAREQLLMMRCKYRYTYGQLTDQLPSRFLDEVPDTVPQEDASHWNERDFARYFRSWIEQDGSFSSVSAQKLTHGASQKPAGEQRIAMNSTYTGRSAARHKTIDSAESTSEASQEVADELDEFSPRSPNGYGMASPAFADKGVSKLWKRFDSVMHQSFGRGVIEKIEQKSNATYLTIRFKSGIKKLDASYISSL